MVMSKIKKFRFKKPQFSLWKLLGSIFLVSAIAAGVVLAQKPQFFQPEAGGGDVCDSSVPGGNCGPGYYCRGGFCVPTPPPPGPCPNPGGKNGTPCNKGVCPGETVCGKCMIGAGCDPSTGGLGTPPPGGGGGGGTPPPGGGGGGGGINLNNLAKCTAIKVYSDNWTLLTTNQASTLPAGKRINFCAEGEIKQGIRAFISFNKGRFIINNDVKPATTARRPGSKDFCQAYTTTAASQDMTVKAGLWTNISRAIGWVECPTLVIK